MPRSGYYEPIRVDAEAARRGVRLRLGGAVGAIGVTLLLVGAILLGGGSRFLITMLASMAVSSFVAAVALLLSARREEEVHRLANELQEPAGLLPPAAEGGRAGADGHI